MGILESILKNQVLVCAAVGWLVAQLLKLLIEALTNRTFSFERIYGSGGMPSSHSSTVCALATAAGFKYGLESFEFAISFILAMVVMYDAMGVRRETGKQAKLLNMIMEQDFWDFENSEVFHERLKELVGHTPLQVWAGAILGIIIACVVSGMY